MEIKPKNSKLFKSVGIDHKKYESWRPGFEEWLDKFNNKPRLAQIMHLYIDMLEREKQKNHIRVSNFIIAAETALLVIVLVVWR